MADDRLAAMRRKFVARAREQAARLAELRAMLGAKTVMPPEALHELNRLCHSLHGAAGTFGFAEISEAAAAAEDLTDELAEAGSAPDAPLYDELDAAVRQVLDLILRIG